MGADWWQIQQQLEQQMQEIFNEDENERIQKTERSTDSIAENESQEIRA